MAEYPESPVHIVGWDAAGVIDEVGGGTRPELVVGADVIAVLQPSKDRGAQAEYVVAPQESVVLAPTGATAAQASTLLMNALTARIAVDLLRLDANSTVAVRRTRWRNNRISTPLHTHRRRRTWHQLGCAVGVRRTPPH